MNTIQTKHGTNIAYKYWGTGQPILFSHGWPLAGDAWAPQMLFFASQGFRVIAHDRRGHGASDQPWDGNNMDQYADDSYCLTQKQVTVSRIIAPGLPFQNPRSIGCVHLLPYMPVERVVKAEVRTALSYLLGSRSG